jgi:hypothetical protein
LDALASLLTERFGGITSYIGGPAEGRWKSSGATERDTIVLLEVMIDDIDVGWWRELRERVEAEFKQEEVVIRSVAMQRI